MFNKIISVPCMTLFKKEVKRFTSVFKQTIFTPVLSSFLYLFIFGYSLGKKISMDTQCTYLEFIIPGLIIMGIINNSYQNTASSVITSKFHGNIHDILVAPITYIEIVIGYTAGALVRGILVGFVTYLVSLVFTLIPVYSLTYIVLIGVITSITFAQIGIIAGIISQSFDQLSIVTNYILMPLTYLGGVFYSINILSPFFQKLTLFNPLFYMVDTFRYGFLGSSDINPVTGTIVSAVFCLILNLITIKLLKSGYRLRT
ncbi:ABC transporter permease [bacterium]|nr:ABC transporter permease [bacterium]